MADRVGESYDAMAEKYAELFLSELEQDTFTVDWLGTFAERAAVRSGTVLDLGCGPGHVANHLSTIGLAAVGYDLSPGQIAQARKAFPDLEFHVGDLTALDLASGSVGGIVSRYSVIHLPPTQLGDVFREWIRVLEPSAPVLVSFFGSPAATTHGAPFDHKVVTAYELFPATVMQAMEDAGFCDFDVDVRPPLDGGRPFDRAMLLACKPDG